MASISTILDTIGTAISTLQGLALGIAGNVFFVSNVGGLGADNTTRGTSPDTPFATLDYAIGQCSANRGDMIVVMPGHAESIVAASGVTVDVAGITIVGLGNRSLRPTFTYTTATTATMVVSAANVNIVNLRFVAGIDSLASFLTVSADRVTIKDCTFSGDSSYQFLNAIGITTTYDYTEIVGCTFWQTTDPAGTNAAAGTGCIYLVDSEHVRIKGCEFIGNFETAFIHNKTTAAADLWVTECTGICSLADAVPFVLVSTATGGAVRCSMITPAEAATTEATLSGTFGAGFFNFLSYFGNDGGGGQLAIASQSAAS